MDSVANVLLGHDRFYSRITPKYIFDEKLWGRLIYGFAVGFLFGWIMNLWGLLGFIQEATWETVISYYVASFYFDRVMRYRMLFSFCYLARHGLRSSQDLKKYGILDEHNVT